MKFEAVDALILAVIISIISFFSFAYGVEYGKKFQSPPLVGYACEGTNGVIYAFEEDHFPPCHLIHRKD